MCEVNERKPRFNTADREVRMPGIPATRSGWIPGAAPGNGLRQKHPKGDGLTFYTGRTCCAPVAQNRHGANTFGMDLRAIDSSKETSGFALHGIFLSQRNSRRNTARIKQATPHPLNGVRNAEQNSRGVMQTLILRD